jgi:hypothetical protein
MARTRGRPRAGLAEKAKAGAVPAAAWQKYSIISADPATFYTQPCHAPSAGRAAAGRRLQADSACPKACRVRSASSSGNQRVICGTTVSISRRR